MFVETKREGEVQAKPKPSLSGFVAWLATKPPNEEYDFSNHQICALGQYYRSLGLYPKIHAIEVFSDAKEQADVLAFAATFGQALERTQRRLTGGQ
jgi:hypothetical protein